MSDAVSVPELFDRTEAAPGPTQTGYITPEAEARVIPRIPPGRLGQPEDIAEVAVFLASEQGRWLTGQKLYAGGGKRPPL